MGWLYLRFITISISSVLLRLPKNKALIPLSIHSLQELQVIPSRPGENCLLTLLSSIRTIQGRKRLEYWLVTPLANLEQIEKRQQAFQFVTQHLEQVSIELTYDYLNAAQNHLASNLAWYSSKSWLKRYGQSLWLSWFHTPDFYQLHSGTIALQLVLIAINQQTAWWRDLNTLPAELGKAAYILQTFFNHAQHVLRTPTSYSDLLEVDFSLRNLYAEQIHAVLEVVYELEVYCSIARFVQMNEWSYPVFCSSVEPIFEVKALTHPLLNNDIAVGNDFGFSQYSQLTLLSGSNMSGKSTFIKACGLAVYLAHLGLPVPAKFMRVSFFNHLVTSIHLVDNLELNHSHFYNELMRIKDVAKALSDGEQVFFLADELFRGTNPEDARLCAQKVIDKLLQRANILFIISSHLAEIGIHYKGNSKVQFKCFQTKTKENKLFYNYKIEPGISQEKIGLLLLYQTGILTELTKSS